MQKNYSIGQVIFAVQSDPGANNRIPLNSMRIEPVKIISKHTTENEEGIRVEHIFAASNDSDRRTSVEHAERQGIKFLESLEAVESFFLQKMSDKIKASIDAAKKQLSQPFFAQVQPRQVANQEIFEAEQQDVAIMTLEDGTRVRVPRNLLTEV